jgi:3-oxoadipate enol-lactonase
MTALHHQIAGPERAPVVLMGESLGTNLTMWDRQLPLADRLRLVRFDHRGQGASPAPPGPYEIAELGRDVIELLDRLGCERVHYCGLSLGGMVGMWLGANAPERVERLVLMCTAAYMPPASMWEERIAVVSRAGSVEPLADAVLARWLTPAFAAANPELWASLRAMLAQAPPDGYAACCGAIARMDLRGTLESIQAPTLVISGAEDLATPPEQQASIARAIPVARHETVAPAAHLAAVEQSETVNRLILEHLTDDR